MHEQRNSFNDSNSKRNIASVHEMSIDYYLNKLPIPSWRNGFKRYMQMLGIGDYHTNDLSGSNRGLFQYNKNLFDNNPCFAELAQNFYDKLEQNDEEKNQKLKGRLNETTLSTRYESGWLWNMAEKAADGDSNLAMTLIGLCGGDNAGYETFLSQHGRVYCGHKDSGMYVQGSLGEETFLNDRLIKEIGRTQAPTKGISVLPSKYYHVLGSAYMACTLVQEGVHAPIIRNVTAATINTYRMQRLCYSNYSSTEDFSIFQYEKDIKKIALEVMKIRKGQSECNNYFNKNMKYNKNIARRCLAYDSLNFSFASDLTAAALENELRQARRNANVAKVMEKYIITKKACSQPVILDGAVAKLDAVSRRFTNFCMDLSKEECAEVKQVLRTYVADFKWSKAQHLKGAEFAINNCKKQPNFAKEHLEKSACKALRKIKNHSGYVSYPENNQNQDTVE